MLEAEVDFHKSAEATFISGLSSTGIFADVGQQPDSDHGI